MIKYTLVFLLMLFSAVAFSQDAFKNKVDSFAGIAQKWELVKTYVNSNKDPEMPEGKQFFVIKIDGTYQTITDHETVNGKWKLDTHKKTLTTHDKDKRKVWEIKKFTKSELRIKTVNNDNMTILMVLKS